MNRLAGSEAAILARWSSGTCEACGLRIERGQSIVRDEDGWVHVDCFDDREAAARAVAERTDGDRR